MSNNTSKWLMGCGIGCGVLIMLIIIVVATGYFFVKDKITNLKELEESSEILEEKYGSVRDFCPAPDGSIKAERIEAFLSVRDSLALIREEMTRSIGSITDNIQRAEREEESFWNVLTIIRKGVGAIPQLFEYYKVRNEALLQAEMGLGEYYYIYVIAYYSWLGKSPEDGPKFQLMGGDNRRYRFEWDEEDITDENSHSSYEENVKEERRYRIIRRVQRMFLPMLRCQLNQLKESSSIRFKQSWQKALTTEIETLENKSQRLPWQDGLPDVIKASLNPFREQLKASYSAMLNPVELSGQSR